MKENNIEDRPIIAYLIWKGSYNVDVNIICYSLIIAYLIWKGSYNPTMDTLEADTIIAYLIWK